MRVRTTHRITTLALAIAVALALTPASGAADPSLQADRFVVQGDRVLVHVANLDATPRSVSVVLGARLVGGDVARAENRVPLSGGPDAWVVLCLPDEVREVVVVGVVLDDGSPFGPN